MFDPLAGKTDEEKVAAIKQAVQDVARTRDGQILFAVLLDNLYLFREAKDANAQALSNFAKWFVGAYFDEDAPYRAISALIGG